MQITAAKDLITVQKKVADLIKGRILVGHALYNDLKVAEIRRATLFWIPYLGSSNTSVAIDLFTLHYFRYYC